MSVFTRDLSLLMIVCQAGQQARARSRPAVLFFVCAAQSFDFKGYMKQRAVMVNEALDKALPRRHPEVLLDSMRWAWDLGVTLQHLASAVDSGC